MSTPPGDTGYEAPALRPQDWRRPGRADAGLRGPDVSR